MAVKTAVNLVRQTRGGFNGVCTSSIRAPTRWFRNSTRAAAAASSSSSSSEPFYGSPRRASETYSWNQGTSLFPEGAGMADCLDRMASQMGNGAQDRVALTLQQAAIAMRDPTRADAVAAVGELTGTWALRSLHQVMEQDPVGRIILHDRPIVSKATIPYETLLAQAADIDDDQEESTWTFGQAYGRFLQTHGFDPDERDVIKYVENDQWAYVMLRYRQSHDFYHVLTGLPPTVLGELALKWLELFQTHLPLTAYAGVVGGSASCTFEETMFLWNAHVPWAQRVGGKQMKFGTLLNTYYEKEWDTPLVELRQRMGVEVAPSFDSSDQFQKSN